ncbi:MAG: TerC/Alx family metal homeostasis membrane protein, partial [Dokdonella sp.]
RKVLMIGVLGALLLRAIMIFIGAALIARFHWVLYLFGAFLVFTGIRMFMSVGEHMDMEKHPVLRWMRNHLRVTPGYRGGALSVVDDGKRWFTPLFLVVVLIGFVDIVFAVDSIPAIFAITEDPFIVLTSNIFAVLGLRALFFMLAGMADRFHLLNFGLAAVLVFIGAKMLIVEFWKIPIGISLLVVALLIAASMIASALFPAKTADEGSSSDQPTDASDR